MSAPDNAEPRVVVTVRMKAAARDAMTAAAKELGLKDGRSEFIRDACAEKLARFMAEKAKKSRTP